MVATDGNAYQYRCDIKSLEEGDLVRVVAGEDKLEVKRLTEAYLSGKVNGAATKLGDYTLAGDIQIIDTYKECTPIRIYPDRLAGMEITEDMVRYYVLNSDGEITHLILDDATGDIHEYGVITDVVEINVGLMVSSTYTYDIGGQPQVFSSDSTIYNLHVGGCQVRRESDSSVERLYNLTEQRLESISISDNVAVGNNRREYALADQVTVYVYQDGEYLLSSLSKIAEGNRRRAHPGHRGPVRPLYPNSPGGQRCPPGLFFAWDSKKFLIRV